MEDLIRELFPNKDYSNRLDNQFSYSEMIQFALNAQIETIKQLKQLK